MRQSIRLSLLAALFASAACERPVPAARPAEDRGSFAAYTTLAERIDTLVTLGDWLTVHPRDAVTTDLPEGLSGERVCRVARSDVPYGSRRMVRSAVFNLPEPSGTDSLPSDTTRIAERFCHLRAIWLEVAEPDSAGAAALADSIASALGAKLGASSGGIRMAGFGTGLWTSTRSWPGSGVTVVLGVAHPEKAYDDSGHALPRRPRAVIAAAYAPNSGLDEVRWNPSQPDTSARSENDRALSELDSVISWAALPSLSGDLGSISGYQRHAGPNDPLRTPKIDSILLHAARLVRDTAPFLEPARRAAALLAVDISVERTVGSTTNDSADADAQFREQMEQLGLHYDDDPLGGSERYTRPWLWEAFRADSSGRAGHLAFMTLLAAGWSSKPNCQDGAEEYARVITQGNAALDRGDSDPSIHYYLGVANHDIVALSVASGALSTYADRSKYGPVAAAARRQAIEHFRRFLAAASTGPMRMEAWRMAMALLAGRSVGVTYYCVYD